jgi:hypothetical protein
VGLLPRRASHEDREAAPTPLLATFDESVSAEPPCSVYANIGPLLVPECLDPFVETSEYGGKYVPPLVRIVLILAWRQCIRGWVEVLAGVVIVRMAIPATLPRIARPILLSVMDAEVVGLEPPDPKIRTRNPARKVSEVVLRDDSVRRIRGACLDIVEASASREVRGNPVQNFSIDATENQRYQAIARVRDRLDALERDMETLETHHSGLLAEIREVVCPGSESTTVSDRIAHLEAENERLREELTASDTTYRLC